MNGQVRVAVANDRQASEKLVRENQMLHKQLSEHMGKALPWDSYCNSFSSLAWRLWWFPSLNKRSGLFGTLNYDDSFTILSSFICDSFKWAGRSRAPCGRLSWRRSNDWSRSSTRIKQKGPKCAPPSWNSSTKISSTRQIFRNSPRMAWRIQMRFQANKIWPRPFTSWRKNEDGKGPVAQGNGCVGTEAQR